MRWWTTSKTKERVMTETMEVKMTRVIPASARTVFEAWLDPAMVARFMKPMPGMPDCGVEIDAREGGAFSVTMKAGETEIPIRGEYKTIKQYELLSFSWLSGRTTPESSVTLRFVEKGPNECELTLHHVGFIDAQSRNDHDGGWQSIVDLLSKSVS